MKRLLTIFLVCAILCLCCGCQRQVQHTIFAMDTVMDLQIWGKDSSIAADAVTELLRTLERTWSPLDEASTLSQLNRGQATLTPEQQALLDAALALSQRTGGAFDPQLHSTISLWGFLTKNYRVPTQAELDTARNEKLWNLGALLKGYAGQQAAELLATYRIDRAILNLGGNIQTFGSKADGAPWQIGIQSPNGGDMIGILSISGTASVVTSGDYQRYFDLNSTRYHHILDPKTGYPADSGLQSVTVICKDGTTADALSTALFVLGLDAATEFWRESDDFEAVFLLADGSIYATEGAQLSGCEFEVISRAK